MSFRTAILLLGLLLAVPSLRAQGIIEGTVALPATKTAPVVVKRYDLVSKGGVISTNPPLAVVYLEGNFPAPATPAVRQIIQKELTFIPALLPVQVGTKVEFPNEDDTYHNIFSYSPAKRFDLGRYRPEERPIPFQIFDKPGLVTLRCDIHEHMRGAVLVLATPYFTMTDAAGKFRLPNVPPGHYTLKAWISSKETLEQPVEVRAGATAKVHLP